MNNCKRNIGYVIVKRQSNCLLQQLLTSIVNFSAVYLLSSVLSSIRSGFVTLTLDYALAYPDNKLDVSAIS